MDDDLQNRFEALSVPEFRRRVDLALGWIRELRRGLSVHAGMTLEQAPGPIPELDREQAERAFNDIVEMLPLLQRRLSPEEKAAFHRPTAAENEAMKEMLEELADNPEAIEALQEEGELELSREKVIKLRESFDKTDMLGELERETRAFVEELNAYKARLVEEMAAIAAKVKLDKGPAN